MKTVTKSKYDLDISFIYKEILTRINKSSLNSKRRKVLLDEIEDTFNKFCIEHSVSKVKAKSIKKENNFYLYNENSCEGTFFSQWLTIFIIISPIYLIAHILDYHYNSTKDKVIFLNKIEFLLLGFLYNYSEDFDLENHLLKVSDWVERRKENLGEHQVPYLDTKDNPFENRINCEQEVSTIRNYFSKFLKVKDKNDKYLMSENELEHFLYINFQKVNKPNNMISNLLDCNVSKSAMRRFVYEFYNEYDQLKHDNKQKEYCKMLVRTFKSFKNDNINNLSKHFSDERPKYYPFS